MSKDVHKFKVWAYCPSRPRADKLFVLETRRHELGQVFSPLFALWRRKHGFAGRVPFEITVRRVKAGKGKKP